MLYSSGLPAGKYVATLSTFTYHTGWPSFCSQSCDVKFADLMFVFHNYVMNISDNAETTYCNPIFRRVFDAFRNDFKLHCKSLFIESAIFRMIQRKMSFVLWKRTWPLRGKRNECSHLQATFLSSVVIYKVHIRSRRNFEP